LAEEIDCPSHIHDPHDLSQENPYFAYLSLADRFIVTCDSASMIAEACLMRRPVCIFDLPVKYDRKMRTAEFLRSILLKRQGSAFEPGVRIYEFLVEYGLMTSTRDLRFYADVLWQKGLIARFGEKSDFSASTFSNDQELELTRARIQGLLNKT
jgi:predicted DNA-binding transcriptional regulator